MKNNVLRIWESFSDFLGIRIQHFLCGQLNRYRELSRFSRHAFYKTWDQFGDSVTLENSFLRVVRRFHRGISTRYGLFYFQNNFFISFAKAFELQIVIFSILSISSAIFLFLCYFRSRSRSFQVLETRISLIL